jgi:SMODS and SLOG-associating 2TM effector domain 1/Protein of unknown function (DUF4231)
MDQALDLAWSQYRGWAMQARTIRAGLDRWRLYALALTVAGAALATVASQWGAWFPSLAGGARFWSGASGVSMALAAWATRAMLDATTEKNWIRARALAERAKSEAFRYATQVPPYHGGAAAQQLLDTISAMMEEGRDIPAIEVPADPAKSPPVRPLAFPGYLEARYNDQRQGFYLPGAAANERKAARCTRAIQGLSAIAAALGALSALHGGSGFEIWIATLGAVTSAIGAYAAAQRYQRLAATYRLAADRLTLRYTAWFVATQNVPDPLADRAFIVDVESILNGENQAWVADVLSRPPSATGHAGDASQPAQAT